MTNAAVFSDIADRYDRLNRILSLGRDQAWRRRVVSLLPKGRLLDLGAGTGAANPLLAGRSFVALDPAPEMLARNDASLRVVGAGEALPFDDASFDAVFSAFVFRNLDDVDRTVAEIARVLRPDGRAGIVDLGRPRGRWTARIHRTATSIVLPLAGAAVGAREEYTYLHRSLDERPDPVRLFAGTALRLEETWRMGPLGFVWGAILRPRR